jgi:hypothetical protein
MPSFDLLGRPRGRQVAGLPNVFSKQRGRENKGEFKGTDVILAGALGAAGSVASGSAIRVFSGAELSLGQSTAVAANAGIGAGAFTMGYSSLEKDQESESTQCECNK